MRVNIGRIRRQEGTSERFSIEELFDPFQYGTETLTFAVPVRLDMQVTNTGRSLLVQGTINVELKAHCARCLEEFAHKMVLPYEDEWVFVSDATPEQRENALLFDQDEVEIHDRVFEQIVLGLPMKFICSSDCQGLCPQCGVNRNDSQCNCPDNNVDPRLADLAQWYKK